MTVKNEDPLEAAFPSTTLSPPKSEDITTDWLPTPLPTLIDTRMLPSKLIPTQHSAELSDAQPVRSHMLCPSLADNDGLVLPNPIPKIVI